MSLEVEKGSGKGSGVMLKPIGGSRISGGECMQVHTGSAMPDSPLEKQDG